jgi:adenylate cyclase
VPRAGALLICAAVWALIVGLRATGSFQFFEEKAYDALLLWGRPASALDSNVIFVGMTEADIKALGFPMPDATMAALLEKVLAGNPRAIAVDIFRDRPLPPEGEGRAALVARIKDPRVVSVIKFDKGGTFIGAPPEVELKQLGYADFPTDDDGRVRRVMLFFTDEASGKPYWALSVQLARRYLAAVDKNIKFRLERDKGPGWFGLGKWTFRELRPGEGAYANADTRHNQILIDYRHASRYVPVPASAVLDGSVDPASFAGKGVIIGMAAPDSVKDFVDTPLAGNQFGAEVHAIIADQLIRAALSGRGPVVAWSDRAETGFIAGWVLLGGAFGILARKPVRAWLLLAASVVVLVISARYALGRDIWLPAVPAAIGCVASAVLVAEYLAHRDRGERAVLHDLFNRIVDKDVADTLWQRRDELMEEGHLAAREVLATVLFTDLEGFTTITEAMDKSVLMAFLNDYMAVMSGAVGGRPDAFVNKYIGDAIMAVFGPPLERSADQARDDARNAVECALEMRARLAEHRERWEQQCADGIRRKLGGDGRSPPVQLRMRIGIQSGPVTAGSLGSRERLEYTVIGDTVNTAARLESYDKDVMAPDIAAAGCRILIGQQTLDLIGSGEYLTRQVGSIKLKGKEQMVTLHGVVGRRHETSPSRPASPETPGAPTVELASRTT